jgi:hypothetical protein
LNIGAVRRCTCVNDAVKVVQCFGWAFVYWNVSEKTYVVAEVSNESYGEFLGIFTALYAARNGAWVLAEQIMESRGR